MPIWIYIMIILIFACVFGGLTINFIQLHISTESTTAVIKDVRRRVMTSISDGKMEKLVYFYPVFEYYVEGEKIEKESAQSFTENVFEVGQKLNVKYSPKYPKDAYIEMFEKDFLIRNILGAIIAATLAIIIFVAFYFNR